MAEEQGKNMALASMVLGIVGLVLTFFINGLLGLIAGIVGLVLAGRAKAMGFTGGMRTAGFVMNLICVIVAALAFLVTFVLIGVGISMLG